ncbi:hypothetical protein BJ878DRAFT_484061 [Calycina marina]|uniref:2EXR domain-containing protein n=1 Tax=Calycina marina TaxID=1763456 RepID=A0A9P7YVW6_9HELO|nr:hypothetical protein BJ878DRAFT_484061 [Calycina marina]
MDQAGCLQTMQPKTLNMATSIPEQEHFPRFPELPAELRIEVRSPSSFVAAGQSTNTMVRPYSDDSTRDRIHNTVMLDGRRLQSILQIWKYAAMAPRFVDVFNRPLYQTHGMIAFYSLTPGPAVLRAMHESRNATIHFYPSACPHDLRTPKIRSNLEVDTLYFPFHAEDIEDWMSMGLSNTDIFFYNTSARRFDICTDKVCTDRVRRLAVAVCVPWQKWKTGYLEKFIYPNSFANLEELTLINCRTLGPSGAQYLFGPITKDDELHDVLDDNTTTEVVERVKRECLRGFNKDKKSSDPGWVQFEVKLRNLIRVKRGSAALGEGSGLDISETEQSIFLPKDEESYEERSTVK